VIGEFDKPLQMSGKVVENFLEVKFFEHSVVFDLSNNFNKLFSQTKKRGNVFDDRQIVEPGFLRAINGLRNKFKFDNVIDVGCQHLYTTLIMERMLSAKVYAYDIDDVALEAAELNLKYNPSNIELKKLAIGDKVTDGYSTLEELPTADLIMIDVEGYQDKILYSGTNHINVTRPIVILETDNHNAINYTQPDKLNVRYFSNYKYFYCNNHIAINEPFREIKLNDIPVQDGLLVCIPEEKL